MINPIPELKLVTIPKWWKWLVGVSGLVLILLIELGVF